MAPSSGRRSATASDRVKVRFEQELSGRREAIDALEALALRNMRAMRRRRLPPLYQAGVRYVTGRRKRRQWKTAKQVLDNRQGDCADLAAYRVAELRMRGIPARFVIRSGGRPGLYHIVLHNGVRVEDPSRRLGMK